MTCKYLVLVWCAGILSAAEPPYAVTYSHALEEPGSLEVAFHSVVGSPKNGNSFVNTLMELEYGVKTWWTSELYLSGQRTNNESTLFTGYRIENRFRPLLREHWINPVLYVEFANLNGADKSFLEVVGHDSVRDALDPNSETRLEKKREVETKLILSSNFKGWNASLNIIAEKNLNNNPWEFGYAAGMSRYLGLAASSKECAWCLENLQAGVEIYGGLGERHSFGLRDTSHYLAPTLAWRMPSGVTLCVSPAVGLNDNSHRALLRFSIAYEVSQFGRSVRRLFQ